MVQFFTKCLLLIIILFIGVFAGLQLTNAGLRSIQGYRNVAYEQVVRFPEENNGNAQVGTMFIIEEKQKKLESLKSFNIFSKLGDGLTVGVQKMTRVSTEALVGKIQEIFQ